MSTLRIVPVVDGIGEAGTGSSDYCTCICVNNYMVFVGRFDGTIERYQVTSPNQPVSVPTVNLLSKVDTGSKRPINSIQSVGNCLLALSGDVLYFIHCSFEKSPSTFMKGVVAFAFREDSLDQTEYPSIVISSIKKKLLVYHYDNGAYVPDDAEISTGVDLVSRIVWLNSWIVGASSRSYLAVSPFSADRLVRDILPVDNAPTIGMIRQSNELILTGHEGLGIFLNIHASPSDFPTPAPRSTVPLDSHEPLVISALGNYMVALTPSDGSVNVFTLVNANDTKLVQAINLPGSCTAGLCSNNDYIGVVSGPVMYLLIPVPFETQFKKLIEQKKFQEALEVINYQYPSESEKKQSAISMFHKEVGWSQIKDGNFAVAFVHFSLFFSRNFDMDALEKLFKFIRDSSHAQDSAICTSFLQSQRNVLTSSSSSPLAPLMSQLDSVLIHLLSQSNQHDELIAFLRQPNLYVDASTVRATVGESDPFVLALIMEKEGDVEGAIELLLKLDQSHSQHVIELLNRPTIPDSRKAHYLNSLLSSAAFVDKARLVGVIRSLLDEESKLSVFGSLEKFRPDLASEILVDLAPTDLVARNRIVAHFVETNNIQGIENLISEYGAQLQQFLPRGKFPFCDMLILGKEGKHKEAFQIDPSRAEEYIERQPIDQRPDLYLVMISVLFDNKDFPRAISLIEKNLSNFKAPSRLVQLIPPDYVVDRKILDLLRSKFHDLTLRKRSSIVEENLGSYAFLNTYSEWSKSRQTNPVVVGEDSVCAVCNQPVSDQFHRLSAVAVLPNSTIAHPACIDGSVGRKGGRVD